MNDERQTTESWSETLGKKRIEPVLLTPVWDRWCGHARDAEPSVSAAVLVIGGTLGQQRSIRARHARARLVEHDASRSIEEFSEDLRTQPAVEHVIWIAPHASHSNSPLTHEHIISAQQMGVVCCFRLVKALLQLGYGGRNLGWTVITRQTFSVNEAAQINPTHASVQGFMGSLAKEQLKWTIRLVDLASSDDVSMDEIFRLPADTAGNAHVYRDGEWITRRLFASCVKPCIPPVYRRRGVYVLAGGADGLGEIFSAFLAQNYEAHVIWLGRGQLDAEIQDKINRCSMLGPAPEYIRVDARDPATLSRAHYEIKKTHAQIHGIVHSATILLDGLVEGMTEDQLQESLELKVAGSVRLAEVFGNETLDFALFFSSILSYLKPPGQSSYVAGSAFENAYAEFLSKSWSCPVKVMNWGTWRNAASFTTEGNLTGLRGKTSGSVEPEDGMAALDKLLRSSFEQLVLLQPTDLGRLQDISLDQVICQFPASTCLVNLGRTLAPVRSIARQFASADEGSTASSALPNDLLLRLLVQQLRQVGLEIDFAYETDPAYIDQWKTTVRMPRLYERWLDHTLRLLRNDANNRVSVDRERVLRARVGSDDVWGDWGQLKRSLRPELSARAELVETALRALPDILTGVRPAVSVFFPGGSFQLMEAVYSGNAVSDYFNELTAQSLVAYVQERMLADPNTRVRILEIGAGTGATTTHVLSRLGPYQNSIEEYCFTDLSTTFLTQARRRYKTDAARYLRYKLFNVERQPDEQGLEPGSYDVVLAANVLHATENIRGTLRNVKACLKQRGMLLLNELSSNDVFSHLAFALLEGWWRFKDESDRMLGSPALAPEQWQRVLRLEGFRDVQFPAFADHNLGQQIIAAVSDGCIRRKRAIVDR